MIERKLRLARKSTQCDMCYVTFPQQFNKGDNQKEHVYVFSKVAFHTASAPLLV